MTRITGVILLMIFLSGCSSTLDEGIEVVRELHLSEDALLLGERIVEHNQVVGIETSARGRVSLPYQLVLRSEIIPPVVEEEKVMASSIDVSGNFMAVSYNFAGSEFRGAVDIIRKNSAALLLESQLVPASSDISSVLYNGNEIYYAGGFPAADSTSFVEKLTVNNGRPAVGTQEQIKLGGHVATSVAYDDSSVYVTTGADVANGGGLYILDHSMSRIKKYIELEDARWVRETLSEIIVLSANPGKVTRVNKTSLDVVNAFAVEGLNSTGFKSTFDISGSRLFVASGFEGVNIYDLNSGTLELNVPLPEGGTTDLYALSVTFDDGIGYVAAGESVFMFLLNTAHENLSAEMVGRLELGDRQSINDVKYKNGYLAIASGLGGTKLVEIRTNVEILAEELLLNGTFDEGLLGWTRTGNLHYDNKSWTQETCIAFSGGNQPVTGVLTQEFSATPGDSLSLRVNYARRGQSSLRVAARLEVIDMETSNVLLSRELVTPSRERVFVTGEFLVPSPTSRMMVKVTDLTENTNGRDFYLNTLSATQETPPAVRVIKISDFEETPTVWHKGEDEEELEFGEVVPEEGRGNVLHLKGFDDNGNHRIGNAWTRNARSISGFEGIPADQIYINMDLKSGIPGRYAMLIMQAPDGEGILRNWVTVVSINWEGWKSINVRLSDFYRWTGSDYQHFAFDVASITTLSLELRVRANLLDHDLKFDNINVSNRGVGEAALTVY